MDKIKKLSSDYKLKLKELMNISDDILLSLREHYTKERLSNFDNVSDFLDDINEKCEGGGTSKLLFIKEVQLNFFYNNI